VTTFVMAAGYWAILCVAIATVALAVVELRERRHDRTPGPPTRSSTPTRARRRAEVRRRHRRPRPAAPGDDICHVVDAPDWRTKARQGSRDKARAEGLIPLLAHQWEQVERWSPPSAPSSPSSTPTRRSSPTASPSRRSSGKTTASPAAPGSTGSATTTAIDDLKTTGGSPPTRRVGAPRSVRHRRRRAGRVLPPRREGAHRHRAEFRFVVVETAPPYAVSVVSLAPSALELAERQGQWAIDNLARCLETGDWPAYPAEVAYAERRRGRWSAGSRPASSRREGRSMTITFRPAVRENVPLLLGLAGGTGSGKTYSAMALAKGLAGGKRFAVIDTENGRAKHYADDFEFDAADLHAPFRPDAYAEAIEAADRPATR
jgi:hypothetical protein